MSHFHARPRRSLIVPRYNAQSHPLPFIKASQVVAPKKGGKKDRPDLEEALDESDEGEAAQEDGDVKAEDEDEGELDLSKDKYVKQPKKKRAPAKGKKVVVDNEDDDEEEKPKKGKTKAKGKK